MIHQEFFAGRNIPDYHPNSLAYALWWEEQFKRCEQGLEINGFRITGDNYFFLNFWKINLLDHKTKQPYMDYPRFSFKDMEIFKYIEHCKKIGRDFLMITGRGAGKSYIASACIGNTYSLNPNTLSFVTASTSDHLIKLWKKIKDGLNEVPDSLYHNRLVDDAKKYRILSGIKYTDEYGRDKTKGYNSEISGVVFGDSAGKIRGGRPTFVVYEEIGSWSGSATLKKCREATEASLKRGGFRTGTSLFIGTGGEMLSGASEDAKDMFYNPEQYNLLTFPYKEIKTAYFLPAYAKFEGFYEEKGNILALAEHEPFGFKEGEVIASIQEDGLCDEIGAKNFLQKVRDFKFEKGLDVYNSELQEFPFTPEEAFMVSTESPFGFLKDRLELVELGKDFKKMIKKGNLVKTGNKLSDGLDEVIFKESRDGLFEILEFPKWYNEFKNGLNYYTGLRSITEEELIKDLYISGCDSYDQAKALTSNSRGSIVMFKRMYSVDETFKIPVAKYTHRPDTPEDFYEATILLNLFYRSKMLFEFSKIAIQKHYLDKNLEYHLWTKPKVALPDMKYGKAENKYGYPMTEKHKFFAIEKAVKYCKDYANHLYFPSLLKELVEFNMLENRFDEAIAFFLCIVQDIEMGNPKPKKDKKRISLPSFQTENGRIVFK